MSGWRRSLRRLAPRQVAVLLPASLAVLIVAAVALAVTGDPPSPPGPRAA